MPRARLTRHHIHLRPGDFEFLITAYKSKNLPANTVIRQIISNHVDRMRAQLAEPPELEETSS